MATPGWCGRVPADLNRRDAVRLTELGGHEAPVLRMATYNIRVDHSADEQIIQNPALGGKTVGQHPWDSFEGARRKLAMENLLALGCDLICLQEPSPDQAIELQQDLLAAGSSLLVQVLPCTPSLWGPGRPCETRAQRHGQEWDGNGFVWDCRRLQLEGNLEQFWFSPTPELPSTASGSWGNASHFFRTCSAATFRDLSTQKRIRAYSAHFDHVDGKVESAKVLMERVRADVSAVACDCILVCGDFNTFPEEHGATYRAIIEAAGSMLVDIRGHGDGKTERGDDTWAGSDGGRFDHMLVSPGAEVLRTAVVDDPQPASDHKPIVAEICLAP